MGSCSLDLRAQIVKAHLEVHTSKSTLATRSATTTPSKTTETSFLGKETPVAYGGKVSGPNHALPTRGAVRYSSGLNVAMFMRTLTYQRMTPAASARLGAVTVRLLRLEGMEAHARSADVRLERYRRDAPEE